MNDVYPVLGFSSTDWSPLCSLNTQGALDVYLNFSFHHTKVEGAKEYIEVIKGISGKQDHISTNTSHVRYATDLSFKG